MDEELYLCIKVTCVYGFGLFLTVIGHNPIKKVVGKQPYKKSIGELIRKKERTKKTNNFFCVNFWKLFVFRYFDYKELNRITQNNRSYK